MLLSRCVHSARPVRVSLTLQKSLFSTQPLRRTALFGGFARPTVKRVVVPWIQHKQHLIVQPSSETEEKQPQQPQKPERVRYNNFIDYLPASWAPYAFLTRIDKPIGTWLLYWPCAWSITMAAFHEQATVSSTAAMLALFGAGAITMRGAGCTINDLWDRDIDDKVERTKVRPIASGAVSPKQAIAFLGGQLAVGLAVLTQLNNYSILLGASSLSLVVTYPLMKRVTYWPQTVLGLAFNWGALLGWSAMTGGLDLAVAGPLYAGGVAWTLVYDTIYAHQDKKDDVKIGVKSTALRFGEKTNQWLTGFSATFVSMTALAGYMNGQGLPFYMISVLGTAAHLTWQLRTVNYDSPADCWAKFKSNTWTGGILWSGIVADALITSPPLLA
ncbi:UbiA prenyltransferase family-domain-containing protein [Gongronella butleri]|nr:UbiA prenyltransferase family-domain-containing protein [Gongronella butleri]